MVEEAEQVRAETRRPSLKPSSGPRPTGVVAVAAWWLVRLLEPIGYVAAAAVGLGLWILLGDYLTGLSDAVTAGLLVASAVALWWAAWVVGNYPFAETWRLGNAIYAAAIGTTGWVVWIVTRGVMEPDARFTLTAAVATMSAYVVQRFRGDIVTWVILLVALFTTGISAGVTLADFSDEPTEAFAVVGALVAAAGGYLIAGQATGVRYRASTLVVLSITVPALLTGFGLSTTMGIAVAAAGVVAAAAAFFATRPSTQIGKISAATNTALAVLVALAQIEVSLPIVLIVAGSVVLAVLGWAAKMVIGSSRDLSDVNEASLVASDAQGTVAAMATAVHDTPGVAKEPPPTAAALPAQGTNALAVASLILGLTWIFWIGSVLAVVFGHMALSQPKAAGGRGIAIAGLVLGYIGLALGALVAVALVAEYGNY